MKYFLDTEFIEGFHKPFLGKRRHFIDLISIGIVAEDGREYYTISNEFDLDYIFNNEDTWVRDNVLKPIYDHLVSKESNYSKTYHYHLYTPFSKKSMKTLLKWHGKSNAAIAGEIKHFCLSNPVKDNGDGSHTITLQKNTEFYAYYADYDWVVFCSLFGRMIDLPKGFPMYCRDLKQTMDEKCKEISETPDTIKELNGFPKQENEHSAIDDARWNKKLYEFLQTI